jgi:hypothetical protein
LPEINFIVDKDGKPVGINRHIDRRPIAAFGNSDGDLPMLQWTATGDGTSLMSVSGPIILAEALRKDMECFYNKELYSFDLCESIFYAE